MRECHIRICERLGVKFLGPTRQYRKATLIERYGPDQNMVDLRLILAADCPKAVANELADFCGVIYADMLPE